MKWYLKLTNVGKEGCFYFNRLLVKVKSLILLIAY